MRLIASTCALVVILLAGAGPLWAQGINWVYDYAQGTQQAATDGKAFLVYFHSPT